MISRDELTIRLLASTHSAWTLETAQSEWWYNRRANGGMRLTDTGERALRVDLDICSYEVAIQPDEMNALTLLLLDRKIALPYYIRFNKTRAVALHLFGSDDATAAILCDSVKNLTTALDTRGKV